MPRESHREMTIEGLLVPNKIRKRGCSSSSSASSRIHSYRLNKRAILVGKNRVGLGGSRSGTPAPTWRTTFLRSAVDSPKYSQSGKSTQPVSARRLAATLWEMNEMPSPKLMKKEQQKKNGNLKREKVQSGWGLHSGSGSGSGSLPPHLSDPSHSPTVSEKMDQCGTRTSQRTQSISQRTPSVSQRLRSAERNIGDLDSISNASFMEVETRSRPPTSTGSLSGSRNRLKDVSNALTTSKELLKIVNRIWANADRPSSTMSVISALHSELERARLQVNQLIQEQPSDKKEIIYLMRCFAEEKASWKKKQQQAIEAAIGSVAAELEAERKSRRRIESLNKKLGKELADMKLSFLNAVEELQSEKRAREITEEVCDELAKNIDENDRAQVDKLTSESIESNQEAEKEREKNSAISKMRRQLEVFLGTKRNKDDERGTLEDDSEVENAIYSKEESLDSDSHSIELNDKKDYKWANACGIGHDPRRIPVDVIKARHSISGQASRRSASLQRSVSDVVEWGVKGSKIQSSGNGFSRGRVHELENEGHRLSYFEETSRRYKPVNGLQDHILSSSRLSSARDRTVHDRVLTTSSKSRTADARGEGQSSRRSRW